jgi:hypothetical protein
MFHLDWRDSARRAVTTEIHHTGDTYPVRKFHHLVTTAMLPGRMPVYSAGLRKKPGA